MKKSPPQKEINKLIKLLKKSVRKKIPDKKFGVLLSGGLDSSLLAYLFKKFNSNFICYVVEFYHPNFKIAEDVSYSKLFSEKTKIPIKIIRVDISKAEKSIPEITRLIKTDNTLMISLALGIYFCMKQAKKDKIKNIFYDCACDCVFAGFQKHKNSKNINKTCKETLENTYKIDFPRDKKLAKHFGIKLDSPFLDNDLIDFALKLPSKYKIHKTTNKYILRESAVKIGLPKEIAYRKKKAIQYSSNAQKMLRKLAKQKKYKKIQDYLSNIN